MKFCWNRTMLNLCGIVVAILKMATGRHFSMSGINSGHHYLPTYQILMISDNVEFLQPFWKWRPLEIFQCRELIRDIIIYPHMKCRWNRTILNVCSFVEAILKMATDRNFSISRIYSGHHNLPTNKCRWNRTMLNLFGSVAAILKLVTASNFHCQE